MSAIPLPKLTITRRFFLLAGMAFAVMLIGSIAAFLQINTHLRGEQMSRLRSMTEIMHKAVLTAKARADVGEISDEEARDAVQAMVKDLRFDDGNYFFIYALDGTSVATGPYASRVGQNFLEERDPDGKPFVRELVDAARRGGDFVAYQFRKPGQSDIAPKISYALEIRGWDWLIGAGVYTDDIWVPLMAISQRLALYLTPLLLAFGLGAFILARTLAQPLRRLTSDLAHLAAGDLDRPVTGTGRRDEIGDIASTVSGFRARLRDRAEDDARAEQRRLSAEEQNRRATLAAVAGEFEARVRSIIAKVREAVVESAGAMTETTKLAELSVGSARTAAGAGNDTGLAVETVAAATEEMSASIGEIAGQVTRASTLTVETVRATDATRRTMTDLAEASSQIASVVGLIRDIAERTNLLALNATIEAARAGDAGRGFAIVASEVKSLASQTARATDDIAARVEAIQSATSDTLAANGGIDQYVRELEAINTAVSAAVEEQNAATGEIGAGAGRAAGLTHELQADLAILLDASQRTSSATGEVARILADAARDADVLARETDAFIRKLTA
ncbi:MAG: cache domain-containing protein [Hyphomicrobiaceae bacterium]|nr:cache domain-containing protein [Hyphomicrobiaceae bacterium]